MECTLSGAGTSHRVNSILVKKQTQVENQAINEQDELQPPTKRVSRRSLPPEAINNEIPEYYSGKRVCPGELKELEKFKDSTKYTDQSYNQRLQYLIWIKLRKLKTHHALHVLGWIGFNVSI